VNLLPKLGVGVDLVSHRYCTGERFECAAERERDVPVELPANVASTDLVKMLPLAPRNCWGIVGDGKGQASGGSGGSGFKAGKLITRLVFGALTLAISVISIRAKARKTWSR
jgi:hypothetical protein